VPLGPNVEPPLAVAYAWPICAQVTSSAKPEVRTIYNIALSSDLENLV